LGGIAETGMSFISTEDEKWRERGHAVGLFRSNDQNLWMVLGEVT